ncbi:hypothetical protein JW960_27140 [candidate division KSB1 bacterium]|nr:hypothetical protein [candidate division KSB1 bacterium]
MKKKRHINYRYLFFCFLCLFIVSGSSLNDADSDVVKIFRQEAKGEDVYVDFDTRMEFYLDMKSKRFLKKMVVKEDFLLQLLLNITDEMKYRGKEKLLKQGVGFDILYAEQNQLIESYSKEIETIEDIVRQLDDLEKVVRKQDDVKLLSEVNDLKDNLQSALGNRKIQQQNMTKVEVASMINDYSREVNRLVKLYEDIGEFEKKATIAGDSEILKQLDLQKKKIVNALNMSRIAGPDAEGAVEEYIQETANLVSILKEVDKLEKTTGVDSASTIADIDTLRKNIIGSIDTRVLTLYGYTDQPKEKNTLTVTDYFKAWKGERVAEYQLKLTQYRVIRNQLIKTAANYERNRMLERDLQDALLNYADNKFELAIVQFDEILKAYEAYYPNLDAVLYYKNEANYALGYYDESLEGYKKLVDQYPQSSYRGKAFYRLMYISYTYGWNDYFFAYYDTLQTIRNFPQEDLYEAQYLAGFLSFKQNDFPKAENLLSTIPVQSKNYFPAQYLLGVLYTNENNFSKAMLVFETIINDKRILNNDHNNLVIFNESLLKLGYLHYQRAEYAKAQSYFEMVSGTYEGYDSSLLGQAWANMKRGRYDNSIQSVDILTNNYLLSNYTYEALVLSAHCKKVQRNIDGALNDLHYVANSKRVIDKAEKYNEERRRILSQMEELERLEENILDRQDRALFPKVLKIRKMINDALVSYYYRGSISGRVYEEFNDERRVLLGQIEEFENIIKFAEEQGDEKMYQTAKRQRDRLLFVLESYSVDNVEPAEVNYFIDYPLATLESGLMYRQDIVKHVMNDLVMEKQRVRQDLDTIMQLLAQSSAETQMEVVMDLEILEEDIRDLHNQLNQFQVWLASHQIEDVETDADYWADFSGFGISDINFTNYYETKQKLSTLSVNISNINDILKKKKQDLEKRILTFDTEVKQIQGEMEAEKIRLEKLEKEKYFRDIYFDTKTEETEDPLMEENTDFEMESQ